MKIFKLTIILILLATKGFSSVFHDTMVSKSKIRPLYININDFENFKPVITTFDTSIFNIQYRNPVRKNNLSFQDLGLIGTPIKIFNIEKIKTTGFDLGFNTMNTWMYNSKEGNDKIIYSPTPYTDLKYTQGEKELIFIEASHSQNINKRLNVGIDYRRIKSNNYLFYNFDNQTFDRVRLPNIYNLKLYSSYHSKNDRFYMLGNLIFNKSTLRESGGLKYPDMFDTTSGKLRAFENNLSNAYNISKQYAGNMKTYYRFGKSRFLINRRDTLKNDTTGYEFSPQSYFVHSINFSKSQYRYTDPSADTPYYQNTFWGKGNSDSIVIKEISNSLGYAIKEKNVISKNYIEISNYGLFNKFYGQQAFYNLSAKSNLIFSKDILNINLKSGFDATYFIKGYNKKDYLLNAFLQINQKANFTVMAVVFSQKHSPDYVQNIYYSTHAIWNQKLNQTKRNGTSFKLNIIPISTKVSITASKFSNYILFYQNSEPAAVDFNYFNADIENNLKFKKIHFVNRFLYQITSKTYNVPQFTLNGQFYFEKFFFKKNMLAQIGFDYNWNSSFYADLYVPYLRQFTWQNEVKTGDYPYIGIFLNARVQTLNFYIKYEHINQGMLKSYYYSTYLYPNVPRFLSFGINWRLFY